VANINGPFGLRPLSYAWGGPYNGAVSTFYVPASNATALFLGDPLALLGNSSDANGVPAVGIATAGSTNYWLGPMLGVSNNAGSAVITVQWTTPVYIPANTAAYVYVADDPNLVHEIQEDSVGGALAATAAGLNANLVAGTGSTVTGWSGWQLQSSSAAVTATLQLRIMRLTQKTGNAIGANAKWLVRNNLNSWLNATGV
jgi:hypothetical protein